MGKTFAEKIFAKKSGKKNPSPGDIVEAKIDYVMVNDVTGKPAFEAFEELGAEPITKKIVLIPDHYVPNKDVASAKQAKSMADFAKKYRIKNYVEVGRGGVCHQVMIELGFVAPGRFIVGADSHTCSYGALGAFSTGIGSTEAAVAMATGELWFKVPESQKFVVSGERKKHVFGKDIMLTVIGDIGVDGALYKSMEFTGTAIAALPLADRISMANMAIEAGGKAGVFVPDKKVFEYLKGRVIGDYKPVYADKDAEYVEVFRYDAHDIVPMVARPFLPSNVAPAADVDVEIDQAYIGSCTNGRIEDLRAAAKIMKGRKVKSGVRAIIVPATQEVYQQAIDEGLIQIFVKAGAFVSGPTCGACLGGYMGVLAPGEKCVSTTNRNFIGRMGDKDSEVYLANPAVAAASAITGRITDPNDL